MKLWNADILPAGGTVLRYLQQLARLPRALAVHCNYLTQQEIRFLGDNPHVAVVYCPRTHQYFGHTPHPWCDIIAAGGTVVLGTDGRSSNPDLSIWKELQLAAELAPSVAAEKLLPMVGTLAANALGLNDQRCVSRKVLGTLIKLRPDGMSTESLLSSASRPMANIRTVGAQIALCQTDTGADVGAEAF